MFSKHNKIENIKMNSFIVLIYILFTVFENQEMSLSFICLLFTILTFLIIISNKNKIKHDFKSLKLKYLLLSIMPGILELLIMLRVVEVVNISHISWEVFVLTIALGPIVEEYIYRYIYINLFNGKYKIILAIISTTLFIVSHKNFGLDIIIFSILYATIYVWTDNIIYSTIMHIVSNTVIMFFVLQLI